MSSGGVYLCVCVCGAGHSPSRRRGPERHLQSERVRGAPRVPGGARGRRAGAAGTLPSCSRGTCRSRGGSRRASPPICPPPPTRGPSLRWPPLEHKFL